MARVRILVVDNYDSFVYNLVQYLAQIGAEVEVWRNDDERFADPSFVEDFDGILLSPGPGVPEAAGVCVDLVKNHGGELPIFGVCLGLQAIGVAYGGVVDRAPELLHGKTSLIAHEGAGVLAGLPSPFTATRYHSLAIEPADAARGAGGDRHHAERCDHGGAASQHSGRGGAVPSRVGADRARLPDARELAGDLWRRGGSGSSSRPGAADVDRLTAENSQYLHRDATPILCLWLSGQSGTLPASPVSRKGQHSMKKRSIARLVTAGLLGLTLVVPTAGLADARPRSLPDRIRVAGRVPARGNHHRPRARGLLRIPRERAHHRRQPQDRSAPSDRWSGRSGDRA